MKTLLAVMALITTLYGASNREPIMKMTLAEQIRADEAAATNDQNNQEAQMSRATHVPVHEDIDFESVLEFIRDWKAWCKAREAGVSESRPHGGLFAAEEACNGWRKSCATARRNPGEMVELPDGSMLRATSRATAMMYEKKDEAYNAWKLQNQECRQLQNQVGDLLPLGEYETIKKFLSWHLEHELKCPMTTFSPKDDPTRKIRCIDRDKIHSSDIEVLMADVQDMQAAHREKTSRNDFGDNTSLDDHVGFHGNTEPKGRATELVEDLASTIEKAVESSMEKRNLKRPLKPVRQLIPKWKPEDGSMDRRSKAGKARLGRACSHYYQCVEVIHANYMSGIISLEAAVHSTMKQVLIHELPKDLRPSKEALTAGFQAYVEATAKTRRETEIAASRKANADAIADADAHAEAEEAEKARKVAEYKGAAA